MWVLWTVEAQRRGHGGGARQGMGGEGSGTEAHRSCHSNGCGEGSGSSPVSLTARTVVPSEPWEMGGRKGRGRRGEKERRERRGEREGREGDKGRERDKRREGGKKEYILFHDRRW